MASNMLLLLPAPLLLPLPAVPVDDVGGVLYNDSDEEKSLAEDGVGLVGDLV